MPSQLNSAGSDPFTSKEGLEISNAAPLEELLDDEELLLELEELLELDELLELEELLDEELLVLEVELLVLLDVPPQPTMAADSSVTLHAKTIFFMIVSHLKSQ